MPIIMIILSTGFGRVIADVKTDDGKKRLQAIIDGNFPHHLTALS